MSVQNISRRAGPFVGTGQTSTFPFSFKVFRRSDVRVVRSDTVDSNSTESVLKLDTDYQVRLNADQETSPGGEVTLAQPLETGIRLAITSAITPDQTMVLTNHDGLLPETLNTAHDKAIALIQELQELLGRGVTLPATSTMTPSELLAELINTAKDAKLSAEEAKRFAQICEEIKQNIFIYSWDIPHVVDTLDDVENYPFDGYFWVGGHGDPGQHGHDISNRFVKANGSTELRTLGERFADVVNVKDFSSVLEAAKVGALYVPVGHFTCNVSTSQQLRTIADALTKAQLHGNLVINLSGGHYSLSSPIQLSLVGGEKLKVLGTPPVRVQLANVGTVSGGRGAWLLKVELADATNVVTGDYLLIRGDKCVVGSETAEIIKGVWKVTEVSGNVVTIKVTSYTTTFPRIVLSGGYADVLKTVIHFNNCDGVVVKNASVGLLDNVAIVGNASEYWDLSNVSGSEKGTHGIHVGGPTVAINGKNDSVNQFAVSQSHISLGENVGVSDFDQQGILASTGGSIYARWCASCSNRRRGWYAETNASIQCKNSIGSGNFLDGYIGDLGGAISCNISSACGNGLSGFFTINDGVIGATGAIALYNSTGFEARSGFINAGNCVANNNVNHGVYAQSGASVFADGIRCEKNGRDGLSAIASVIRCINPVTLKNNVRYGVSASFGGSVTLPEGNTLSSNGSDYSATEFGSIFSEGIQKGFSTKGDLNVQGSVRLSSDFKITRDSYFFTPALSSIGNLGFNLNGKVRLNINSGTGAVYAETDNAQELGRSSNRWSQIFASTGVINTSDERAKTSIASPEDALMRAWGKVNFRVFKFKDAVEKKGIDARLHVGVIAQEVKAAFESEGLDANRFGLLCYDEWEDEYETVEVVDTPEVLSEQGEVITPANTHVEKRLVTKAGNRYGIRYEEALALECAYLRWELQKIKNNQEGK